MIQIFKMAFRDLRRNRRRSFFSALALGMGLSLLLLIASVLEWEMRQAMTASITLQSGHIQIQAEGYSEDRTSLAWEDLIENPEVIAGQVASLEAVKDSTPRLFASGIVTSGDLAVGVRIIGIDPASGANAPYSDGLLSGEFIQPDDTEGVLIGEALAEKLDLGTGQRINLLVNTSNGDVDEQLFTIRGIYTTEIPAYDEVTVLMPLAKTQAITQAEDRASTIFVLLDDREQANQVVNALETGQYQVKTWVDMNELLVMLEQFSQAYMFVIYLIIMGITATVVVNTLVMAVFERTREIGILAAIGMKGRSIMALFFAESLLLAVGGIIIGLILGGVMVYFISTKGFFIGDFGVTGIMMSERIYGYLTLNDTITLTILTFIIALLAALYPALLAARMQPVDALHGGQ